MADVAVTVVVVTYRPGERLRRPVSSLLAQTIDLHDVEVLFVDDGSADGTLAALEEAAERFPVARVIPQEHTGWPSHARNVGIAQARGEYVLFLDHDDELYPDALRAGLAYAREHRADVLAGKESRTDQPKWGLEVFTENQPNAVGRADVHPLVPTNPHKLYAVELLRRHEIAFPAGPRRLWEDVRFNVAVAAHAERIAILSDVPFYRWVREGRTASTAYADDAGVFFRWVEQIFVDLAELLPGERHAAQRRQLLVHQYRTRVLQQLSAPFFAQPAASRDVALSHLGRILAEHVPTELDDGLPGPLALRAWLARAGAWDALRELAGSDAGLAGIGTARDVGWRADGAHVEARVAWRGDSGALRLREAGDRLLLVVPEAVAAAVPGELLDVTDDVAAARAALGVTSREGSVTWLLDSVATLRLERGDDGLVAPTLAVEATLDPATAAMGAPLDEPVWDVNARADLFGTVNQRPLRSTLDARTALLRGRVVVAYANRSGRLSLDVGQRLRTLVGSAPPRAAGARARRTSPRGAELSVPLDGVVAPDSTTLDGEAFLQPLAWRPAQVADAGDGVRLTTTATLRPGSYRLLVRFAGKESATDVLVRVDRWGRVTFADAERG